MANLLERLPEKARIVVIRLRSLGDCVLTTPALHLLKCARPDLHVTVVVEDAFAAVFEHNPDVDRIMGPNAADVAQARPHLVLNLHGGNRSAQLTFASRARLRAGFAHFRFRAIYNVRIPRAQEILGVERKVHTAEHLASAMFYLGVTPGEIPRARLFTDNGKSERRKPVPPYVVIHPVASAPEKTWPADRFLDVANHLERECGLAPMFIAGPGEDMEPFRRYRILRGAPLAQIKSLLSGAAMFVGNDSGPAHMAAAFGVRSVVLFGPSDREVWAPWKTDAVALQSPEIGGITVDQVTEALSGLLV